MKPRTLLCSIALGSLVLGAARAQTKSDSSIPHLDKRGAVTRLIVDGTPFLVLGGQVNDGTSASGRIHWP